MQPKPTPPTPPLPDIPFVNEMRLNWKLWLATIAILALTIFMTPRVWKRIEKFEVTRDYRIPYTLSKDYWLYQRRLEQHTSATNILLIGDSVIWGEYVLPDGTLSHFLNEQLNTNSVLSPQSSVLPSQDSVLSTQSSALFVNAGVNGLYPLAIDGLLANYADLHNRKIILHCNVLWMSSPKADLQDPKPQSINHSRLLPQFTTIPSYKADANERLSVLVERNIQFMSWVTHFQAAYFNDKSIPAWTLQSDDNDKYPNSYKNPLSQITLRVPDSLSPQSSALSPEFSDPDRGPASPRHKPWTQSGANPTTFEWIDGGQGRLSWNSLQFAAFLRTLHRLIAQKNQVFVLFGPFNTHIISPESKPGFEAMKTEILATLESQKIPHFAPETLPSDLYADASHPLTEGYQLLATQLLQNPDFKSFLGVP